MSKAWMPMYWGDYIADTQHLSQGQHGAYTLLMAHYWQRNMLQASFEQCLRIAKAFTKQEEDNVRFILEEFFFEHDGCYKHKRIEQELLNARKRSAKYTERAKKAALARWRPAEADATSIPQALHEQCQSQSQSQSHISSSSVGGDKKENAHSQSPPASFPAWAEVIRLYDAVVVEIYGQAQARPFPAATDQTAAKEWLGKGAGLDLCRDVFEAVLVRRQRKNEPAPGHLKYFNDAIERAIGRSNKQAQGGNDEHSEIRKNTGQSRHDADQECVKRVVQELQGWFSSEQGVDDFSGGDAIDVLPAVRGNDER
ncbi:hypothetical protein VF14_18520 [Nostoc linckia z18]|uniref:DUF1376 domain-containing protein n=2 Tax=Nostoc linckia TaxID=92942 RepID=A0A9Q5Z587_NOSLI|nr:DUF1376 domain-containing protein [Nostoc linckia]PHJ51100.1 hypothetical protein VF02_38005 [Nostoc linckia z1]PHJ82003.1 hypothetical protein VF07_29380 [Nostoc linckia z6]PHJ83739.1 hypothetical protein VF04_36575 [Nostoc linckia z7]PHJ94040.1 hypothetical protein VF08_34490 [Nostoc linckia z8]PHK09347.1 hypothetical protein VF09_16155 [Nostoc linckia z9]